jgi:hypothetical protein
MAQVLECVPLDEGVNPQSYMDAVSIFNSTLETSINPIIIECSHIYSFILNSQR